MSRIRIYSLPRRASRVRRIPGAGRGHRARHGRAGRDGAPRAAETYNATAADADKVELIFFNRDGFFDKLAADLGAGTTDFDVNLIATYAVGRYAPFMDVVELPASATDTLAKSARHHAVRRPAIRRADRPVAALPLSAGPHRPAAVGRRLEGEHTEIAKEKMGKDLAPKDPDQWTWDDFEATAYFFTKGSIPIARPATGRCSR